MKPFCLLLAFLSLPAVAGELPKTVMTARGKLLVSEDFARPIAPFEGKTNGFASGFAGWCYRPGPLKRNTWIVADGVLTGIESAEAHHPATLSYGLEGKDMVIQCEIRLDDVPADGRKYRSLFVKATDEKDYVCGIFVGPGSMTAVPYDGNKISPVTKQRDKAPAHSVPVPMKLNEWHTLVVEISGDEIVGSLDGTSVTCQNPLIAAGKHSIMLGVGTQAGFRHLRVWEALPNADWSKTRLTMPGVTGVSAAK